MRFVNILGWRRAEKIVSEWEKRSGVKLDDKTRKEAVDEVFRVLNRKNWQDVVTALIGGTGGDTWEGLGYIHAVGSYTDVEMRKILALLAKKYVGVEVYV